MDFDKMTLKEVRDVDLEIVKDFLKEKIDDLWYNDEHTSWFIDDTELVDELYYDNYTILHPKEIIGYVEEIIEDEMKIPKGNRTLANWQEEKLDNQIKDTLPDDEL